MSVHGVVRSVEIAKCPFCKSDDTRPTLFPYTNCRCCGCLYDRYTGDEADPDGYAEASIHRLGLTETNNLARHTSHMRAIAEKAREMTVSPTLEELEGWLSLDEAAKRAGVSFQTVALWRIAGHIRAVKTRREWLYDPDSLDAYLNRLTENMEKK